jgi:uncharacterized protein (DUF736 family)
MSENNTKGKSEWRERELGALWIKQGNSSKDYMTGHCSVNNEKISVVVFKNNNKSSDRAPDYVIYKHKAREEENTAAPTNEATEEVPELLA